MSSLALAASVLALVTTAVLADGSSLDAVLADSIDSCWGSSRGTEQCLRDRLSEYMGAPRSSEGLLERVRQLAATHDLKVQLLPGVLPSTSVVFRAGRGLDFDIEDDSDNDVRPRASEEEPSRDMMKDKMIFPLLMMLKLKLKMLTPILLMLVGLKATKALMLSKLAILLVVGFLIVQICQKLGMAKMSMQPAAGGMMPMMPDPTPMPPAMYGPPSTASSYEPSSWEPASGPYARVDSNSAQQLAYSSYTPQSSSYSAQSSSYTPQSSSYSAQSSSYTPQSSSYTAQSTAKKY